MRSKALSFFFVFLVSFSFVASVHAQSSAGVQLQPSTIEKGINPGETLNESFSLTNTSNSEQVYYLVAKDISGVAEDGTTPIFADAGAEVTGYELSTWVTYNTDAITLAPRESIVIPITIKVPDDAAPGSHFGGIFVTVEPPRLRESGAGVGYEVGSLISLRIAGETLESARIREFSTKKLINTSANIDFSIRVENPGNVLIRPRGLVEINNLFGKRVGLVKVNDTQAGVFPGRTRPFAVSWNDEGLAFGRYQAVLGLTYGDSNKRSTVSATVSFWVLPVKILVPVLGIFSFVVLMAYLSIRLYIRRALDEVSTTQGKRVIARRKKDTRISRLMVVAVTLLLTTTVFLIGLLLLFA